MTHSIEIDGQTVPVLLKRSVQAGKVSLRVDQREGSVIVVLPVHVPVSRGLDFVASKTDWLRSRLAALPQRVPFAEGNLLPILGVPHPLRHVPAARRGVWIEDGAIHVSGKPEYFARRVDDWLKGLAQAEIYARTLVMAERLRAQGLGRPLGRIALRDARTRWGSCTSRGDLTFSWRLVLAPAEVLTYVVAHEVAHLAELNHSPAFWKVVELLAPQPKAARAWLKSHGTRLHRYG